MFHSGNHDHMSIVSTAKGTTCSRTSTDLSVEDDAENEDREALQTIEDVEQILEHDRALVHRQNSKYPRESQDWSQDQSSPQCHTAAKQAVEVGVVFVLRNLALADGPNKLLLKLGPETGLPTRSRDCDLSPRGASTCFSFSVSVQS